MLCRNDQSRVIADFFSQSCRKDLTGFTRTAVTFLGYDSFSRGFKKIAAAGIDGAYDNGIRIEAVYEYG